MEKGLNPCTDAILAEVAAPGQLLAISHYSKDPRASSMEAAVAARFAATGGTVEEVLALDIALLGNDPEWIETLSGEIAENLELALYYGHFMCHVFHQDYVFKKGTDLTVMKAKMLEHLDSKGAKYPAEHNVGHVYQADQTLKDFYTELDPTNTFNPGIGRTSKARRMVIT